MTPRTLRSWRPRRSRSSPGLATTRAAVPGPGLGSTLTLILFLALPACGGDPSILGECPPASQQQQMAGSNVLFLTCTGCHSSQLQGAQRQGAPVGMDFDRIDTVRDLADDIYRTALEGSMPPPNSEVTRLNDSQVESLRVYLACGADTGGAP